MTVPGTAAMTGDTETRFRPTEIRLKREEKLLEVDFGDGANFSYPAELLRVESPSAEVQGHGPGQKTIVAGRRHVGIMDLEAVGHYAVRIKFDDLHDTGIYSWRYLRELGERREEIWNAYLAALAENGLSREPPRATIGRIKLPRSRARAPATASACPRACPWPGS